MSFGNIRGNRVSSRKQSFAKHQGSQRTSSSVAFCSDGEMVHIVTDGGNSTCNVGGVVSKPLIIDSVGDPEVITVDSKSERDYYTGSYPTP